MRKLQRIRRAPAALALGTGLAVLGGPAWAATSPVSAQDRMVFLSHGAAYGQENRSGVEIDPHVFVADSNAPETTGPEGIHHGAGIRPARVADDPEQPLENAQGDALGLSLGRWLATTGTATLSDDARPTLETRFSHLIPFGVYSVFVSERSDDGGNSPFRYRLLQSDDGVGSFTAPGDGSLRVSFPLDRPLNDREAVILVYHSDDTDHDREPGDFGDNAHVQLVLPPPGGDAGAAAPAQASDRDDYDRDQAAPPDGRAQGTRRDDDRDAPDAHRADDRSDEQPADAPGTTEDGGPRDTP